MQQHKRRGLGTGGRHGGLGGTGAGVAKKQRCFGLQMGQTWTVQKDGKNLFWSARCSVLVSE